MSRDLFGAWASLRESLEAGLEEDPSGCLVWTGTVDRGGYGLCRGARAHRLAYSLATGVWEPALVIDHLCGNRRCCHPDHLEAVLPDENTLRVWEVEGKPTEVRLDRRLRRRDPVVSVVASLGRLAEESPEGFTRGDASRRLDAGRRAVLGDALTGMVRQGTLRLEGGRYWAATEGV